MLLINKARAAFTIVFFCAFFMSPAFCRADDFIALQDKPYDIDQPSIYAMLDVDIDRTFSDLEPDADKEFPYMPIDAQKEFFNP